jgi:hypothetical protein
MERVISTKHAQLHLRKARTARSTQQPSHRATTVNEAVRRGADDEAQQRPSVVPERQNEDRHAQVVRE